MPASKKPRRKYNPKRALSAALRVSDRQYACSRIADRQSRDIGIAFHVAFDQVRSGAATEENWSGVACMANLAVTLAEQGLGEEHVPALSLALDAVRRAKERGEKTGQYRFDGDGLTAVETAIAIHDAQIEAATVAEMRAAMNEVARKIGVPIEQWNECKEAA